VQGGGIEKRERERNLQAKSANRTVCFHIIYQEMQFCGHSPRERVKMYILLFGVIDVVLFFFFFSYYCILLLDKRYNLCSRFKGDKE
jgi:hypothetical protein